MTSVIPLPHFGGPSQNNSLRMKFSQRVRDNKDLAFGPASHQQLLQELSSLPGYVERNTLDPIALTAKSFQRNTPALFGLGLIDAVSDEEIRRIARRQVGEPGISGRPATLSTGRIGRFGWRANVATLVDFTRQACVNELGIQVQSDPQASPSGASRRSTSFRIPDDISLGELESLTAFISGLTAPERMVPQEIASHQQVLRGEQLFEGIGCSICHIPNIGEAEGIYSDLLLHDMGFDLRGASTADPYIQGYHDGVSQPTFVRLPPQSYYGRSATLPPVAPNANSSGQVASRRNVTLNRPYQSPPDRIQFAVLETHEQEVVNPPIQSLRGGRSVLRQVKFRRNRVSPTNVSQEWRTPPLWGLRDSAPYLHDGRAATVHEAIMLHAGESLAIRNRYALLHPDDQNVMVAFLNTFVAPANALRD